MKKLLSVILVIALLTITVPALAAGKIDVTNENFIVTEGYSIYGYAYARVENVGDKPIKVNAGLLEIYDANGDALTSDDYLNAYAEYLQPGEYTYVKMYDEVEGATSAADVDDYMLTVSGKSEDDTTTLRLPVTAEYKANVQEGYWTSDYMYATITNDTDSIIYNIETVLVLLDDEENILYMDDNTMYYEGLMPGSSVVIRKEVSSAFKDAFAANGMTPTHVDAIAFIDVAN